MDDDDDGFEPLFSYTKQAPLLVHLSDSDEEEGKAAPVASQIKCPEKKQEQKVEKPIAAQKPKDEEDWLLPPPPKYSAVRPPRPLDRTHVEIRRKQAELLELAERAKDIERQAALAAAEAAAQVAAEAQAGSVMSTARPAAAAAAAAAERILIKVQDKTGCVHSFRISKDDHLDKLFKAYAAAVKASLSQLVFRFDGDQVPGSQTPRHLDLEEEDILEVFLKPATATSEPATTPTPPPPLPAPVQPSRPEKETVRIKVQDKSGHKLAFRIGQDDKFGKLFNAYAASKRLQAQQLVFRFHGDPVSASQTPRSLGMEDEDTMEVLLKP